MPAQFPSQEAGAELARSLQPHSIHQHVHHLRIVGWGLDLRRKQFQLLGFALLVEYLDRLQPTALSRTVQLAQITQRPLTRTGGGPHGIQRPVGVILTILTALMQAQKHPGPILSSVAGDFKRVGLHYIGLWKIRNANTSLTRLPRSKIAAFDNSVTNLA
ncbi:MAG: hypothetical protein LAQ69_37385 [Acidobacteriia bacterium]|nr:hypothetical protein [Terriglobia bacterium]